MNEPTKQELDAELHRAMTQCDYCARFFALYRCNAPDECDCPKCQGYCECPR